MREEYVKNSFHMDGVEVFHLGDEYVFSLENKNGEKIEYHLTKPLKTPEHLQEYIKEKKREIENTE